MPAHPPSAPPSDVVVLAPQDWLARSAAHHERIQARTAPLVALHMRGEQHPVQDFLFGYYSHSPAALARWHPGAGVVLADPDGAAADAEAAGHDAPPPRRMAARAPGVPGRGPRRP